jgi:hypothetical protein
MRVVIDMEIETEDYGGKEFMEEIKKLIENIDNNSWLTKFKMRGKYTIWNDEKDIDWEERK